MSLTLSDIDLQRLKEAESALLSVGGRSVSPQGWCREVVARGGPLFRSDWILFAVRHRGGLEVECQPECGRLESAVAKAVGGAAPAESHPGQEKGGRRGARTRPECFQIWTWEDGEGANGGESGGRPVTGTSVQVLPLSCAALLPDDSDHGGGLRAGLSGVQALLCTVPGYPEDNPFGEAWLELTRLLLPAFEASLRLLLRRQQNQDEILRTFDGMTRPLLLSTPGAGTIHRNPALERLLSRCADPDALLDEVRSLVRCMSLLRRSGSLTSVSPRTDVGRREVTVGERAYRLRGLHLKPGLVTHRRAAMVEVEETTPTLPSERELQERFRLTPREAEIARLLAWGASNREAGEALGISPHTVRSHAQNLFRKLGLHTRKALALRLMADGARDPV